MPRLFTSDDLGQAPSLRPSASLVGGVRANIGAGLAAVGKGMSDLSDAFAREDRFDAERRFSEFAYAQEQSLSEQIKQAQPGASGFRDNVIGNYVGGAKEFLATIPNRLKQEYDLKLTDYERRMSRVADNFETKERERFAVEGVKDSHNKLALLVQADPSNYEKAAESSRVLLDNAPVDAITRETLRKQYRDVVPKAVIEGILKSGGTEQQVRDFLRKLSPGKQTTYAPDTMQGKIAANVTDVPFALAVAERESSFKHDAKASKTIRGLFQMDAETRAKYGLGEDATPEQQAAAFEKEIKARSAELGKALGRNPTQAESYLAWHFGARGAGQLLSADPNTSTKDWVFSTFGDKARAVWDQNKHIRDAGTVGNLVQSISADIGKRVQKYGGESGPARGDTNLSDIEAFAQTRITHYKSQLSKDKAEGYEREIIDAAAGLGALPSRESISRDDTIRPEHKNTLLRQFDAAEKEVRVLRDAEARFNAGAPFNPFNPDDKKAVEKIYQNMGRQEQPIPPNERLALVVERTGVLPSSVATELRGAVVSGDPNRTGQALTVASGLLQRNPNIFDAVDGGKSIEENAVKYRHYTESLEFTPQEAAKRIVEQQTPEYKQKVQARLKNEDIKKIVEKNLQPSDLSSRFNEGVPFFSRPNVGFGPEQKLSMFNDYAELFREFYGETGDISESKKLAQNQLAKVWGVTKINGSNILMRYPPEKSAAMAGIENPSKFVSDEAVASIKKETGKDVDAGTISIVPIPGVTSGQFFTSPSPQYFLFWRDKNGNPQSLNPGRAFTIDATAARNQQSEERRKEFERKRSKEERFETYAPHALLRKGFEAMAGQ